MTTTLDVERLLMSNPGIRVGGVDEVGRGAPAGPVCVGVVVVDATLSEAPSGLRDSKLLSVRQRERLAPLVRDWAIDSAVGFASADEVDERGVNGALRLAGVRALAELAGPVDVVLLDGKFDWLSSRPSQLFEPRTTEPRATPRVVTRVKADLTCSSVAAASVIAKVARDATMAELSLEHPDYGWAHNKGYASSDHWEALRRLGPTRYHRCSWNLPSIDAVTA